MKATSRRRKNIIPSLCIDGVDIADQTKKEECIWSHFNSLLGTYQPRSAALNFNALGFQPCNLSHLDNNFTEKEIKSAIFYLHPEKAPGPDGFTGHFFRSCWDTVKLDLLAAFSHFQNDQLAKVVPS